MPTRPLPRPVGAVVREWWQKREGSRAPFGVEIEVLQDEEVVRRISRPVRDFSEVTPIPSEQLLTWCELSVRERAEFRAIANANGGWEYQRLEHVPMGERIGNWPWRVLDAHATLRTPPPTPEESGRRRALDEAARAAAVPLSTRDLEARKAELERLLQGVEDELTLRWAALNDYADRFKELDSKRPARRRGVRLSWIEEDFPNPARIYEENRARRAAGGW